MRQRVSGLFTKLKLKDLVDASAVLKEELGVQVPHTQWGYNYDKWFLECELRDLLDSVTEFWKARRPANFVAANQWRDGVARIFEEENIGFRLDEAAGVHYSIDQEFDRARQCGIAVLQADRYSAVRAEFDAAYRALDQIPQDTKGAVRAVFDANEILFKLMFPRTPLLGQKEIRDNLAPRVQKVHRADPAALRAANRVVAAFGEWASGMNNYRHGQAVEEPTPPPLPLALVFMSAGAGFLRWQAEMDTATRAAEK
jgi:hypothetical protein